MICQALQRIAVNSTTKITFSKSARIMNTRLLVFFPAETNVYMQCDATSIVVNVLCDYPQTQQFINQVSISKP